MTFSFSFSDDSFALFWLQFHKKGHTIRVRISLDVPLSRKGHKL